MDAPQTAEVSVPGKSVRCQRTTAADSSVEMRSVRGRGVPRAARHGCIPRAGRPSPQGPTNRELTCWLIRRRPAEWRFSAAASAASASYCGDVHGRRHHAPAELDWRDSCRWTCRELARMARPRCRRSRGCRGHGYQTEGNEVRFSLPHDGNGADCSSRHCRHLRLHRIPRALWRLKRGRLSCVLGQTVLDAGPELTPA